MTITYIKFKTMVGGFAEWSSGSKGKPVIVGDFVVLDGIPTSDHERIVHMSNVGHIDQLKPGRKMPSDPDG